MTWILMAAGGAVGALLPAMIARIPDRVAVDGGPPPIPHRELAARPRLVLYLAAATAAVWGLIGVARTGATTPGSVSAVAVLAAHCVVGALGVAMAYVDVRDFRLPDWLTGPAFVVAAGLLALAAGTSGEWAAYGRAWAAAAASVVLYLLLAVLRPGDLGLGDVKLGAVLGLLLGWTSWSAAFTGVFAGFLTGALVAIVLLISGRATRRSSLPFGPAMLVGALAALVWVRLVGEPGLGG